MGTDPSGRCLTVLTATAPTPNGPLHVGHLSGPYIAADVAARAARMNGTDVLTFSGLDPHQNYVPAKALAEGRDVGEVLGDYENAVRRALSCARIGYDVFADPRADAGYRDRVASLLGELAARGSVRTAPAGLARCGDCGLTLHHAYVTGRCPVCGDGSGGGTCEACGAFTTALNLREARCARCGGVPQRFEAEVPLLRLEDHRTELAGIWAGAVLGPRVRALIRHYLSAGLPDVPLAYPTDWGIPTGNGQRVDVWAEMGLGMLATIARRIEPAAGSGGEYAAAWRRVSACWHFLGIDNAFYFAVLFPALFTAAGLRGGWLGGLVVNEFYRLTGAKFSTSRNHAIWAEDFLAAEDPAIVRLFLSWDRPDEFASDFTHQRYQAFREWVTGALRTPSALPAALADAELRRAEQALTLASFDPALALRCLLAAGGSRGAPLMAALAGEGPPAPAEAGSAPGARAGAGDRHSTLGR